MTGAHPSPAEPGRAPLEWAWQGMEGQGRAEAELAPTLFCIMHPLVELIDTWARINGKNIDHILHIDETMPALRRKERHAWMDPDSKIFPSWNAV